MFSCLVTSIDTLLAALGFGMLAPESVERRTVCWMFFIADALAALVGLVLRNTSFGHSLIPVTPAIVAGYSLVAALITFSVARKRIVARRNLIFIAFLLSLDNLIAASSGQGSFGMLSSVLLPALTTGVAAVIGFEAGKLGSTQFGNGWRLSAGGLLLVVPILVR